MQIKTKSTAPTEPKHRPHPDNMHAGPKGTDEEMDQEEEKRNVDAESKIHPDDFDLPEKDVDENVDDEIDALEEANRPG